MKMIIHGKHLAVTAAMRLYAEEKIGKATKHFDNILEIDVTLSAMKSKSGHHHTVEALVYINGATVKATATQDDLYNAINDVSEALDIQIKKIKEKRRDDHHLGHIRGLKYNSETKVVEKESSRNVVSTSIDIRPMALDEAILQLECLGRFFYPFVNSETNELNVIYRLPSGDYGHIEPPKF
ncbi:MAG: ribosome hibernation-promoting factor, HPF/YfiA family [Fusobacteriaceae bacterium]